MAYIDKITVNGTAYDIQDAAAAAMIPEYDATNGVYSVGDYCRYENAIYRCMTAVDTAESFNSTKWTAVTLAKAISQLSDEIDSIRNVDVSTYTSAELYSSDSTNYWVVSSPQLEAGKQYIITFMPNKTFVRTAIQIGTMATSASMVDTIATDVQFTAGTAYQVRYTPTQSGLQYIRMYQSAEKINSITIEKEIIEAVGPYVHYDRSTDLSDSEKATARGNIGAASETTVEASISQLSDNYSELKSAVDSLEGDAYNITYELRETYEQYGDDYWRKPSGPDTIAYGKTYKLVMIATSAFHLGVLQIGHAGSTSSMKITIAEDVDFVVGENVFYFIASTPSATNYLNYLRVLSNASNISSVKFYEVVTTVKVDTALTEIAEIQNDTNYFTGRLNNAVKEMRKIKNETDASIESLLPLKVSENTATYTVTIPSIGAHERALVHIGLHYGTKTVTNSASYYDYDEVYLGENCEKDFSDVRFFDSNGNVLKAEFSPAVNMELCADQRLDKVEKVLSDGTLVAFDAKSGILLSADGGANFTAISGTHNVTENASAAYGRTSMFPVFVDGSDNIFAYAGGKLYKLLSSDDYATKTQVCDFSWDNDGTTVYPDIQGHAMDMDTNGNIVFGTYAPFYHTDVFASTDGGNTFTLSWHSYDGEYQHVHHVHADKYTSKIYVGIDDGGTTFEGSRIIVTENGGTTWTEITDDIDVRGKDYYPTYFGDGYRLGSGETYVMGSASIYRSTDDATLNRVVHGISGVRSFGDFGNDNLIVCGSQQSTLVAEYHIYTSEDKGKTWNSIYKKIRDPFNTSGRGYRNTIGNVTLPNESEPCVIMTRDYGSVPSFKVYKGGNHWYREALVEVKNTTANDDITITVKCGYAVKYPYNQLENSDRFEPVFRVRLNEGVGKYIEDSNGNIHTITGSYTWDTQNETTHFGDYSAPTKFDFMPSAGLELGAKSYINLGKIPNLNFHDNFTFSAWLGFGSKYLAEDYYNIRARLKYIFTIGDLYFRLSTYNFHLCQNSESNYVGAVASTMPWYYSNDYVFVTITVSSGAFTLYINGEKMTTNVSDGTFSLSDNFSEDDFIIGSPNNSFDWGYLSDLCFYNEVLTDAEVLELYRGW